MVYTGSEVWFGSTPGTVLRYDLDGTEVGSFNSVYSVEAMTPVPEPNTALLLGIGLSALAVRREKR